MRLMKELRFSEAVILYILNCFGRELHHRSEAYQNIGCFEVLKALCLGCRGRR